MVRPGGALFAVDARDLDFLRDGHEGDTFVPLDPERLDERLRAAGFDGCRIEVGDFELRFVARVP